MKKFASIILLAMLSFNWIGYQFFISLLESRADKSMMADIDQDHYSPSDLISIKVAVPYLYYYAGNSRFERFDGKVEINDVQYNYVKRRFMNDSLELLCLPNKTATHLRSAREDFFSLVNNIQRPGHPDKNSNHIVAFKSLNDAYSANFFSLGIPAPAASLHTPADRYAFRIPDVLLPPCNHPPDFVCV